MKLFEYIHNILIKESVSQKFDLGPSFMSMTSNKEKYM